MNIKVYIARLIIDGINIVPGQEEKLKAGVETELSLLLEEGGIESDLKSGGAFSSMHACSIRVVDGIPPNRLGNEIARSVYGRIGQKAKRNT